MNAQGTLRRIEQLKQEGKAVILGSMVLHLIDECIPQRITGLTRNISKMVGDYCVCIELGMAKNRAIRGLFEENLPVVFAIQQYPSNQRETVYNVFLGRRGYHVTTKANPDLLEKILKSEVETLNGLGLNLEYAGQYVPPSQK